MHIIRRARATIKLLLKYVKPDKLKDSELFHDDSAQAFC